MDMPTDSIELLVPAPAFTINPIVYSVGYAVKVNIFAETLPESYQLIGFKSAEEAKVAGLKLAHSRVRESF